MKVSRRGFVAGVAGFAALSATGAAPEVSGGVDQAVIDTHIHIWDLKTLNPPWLTTAPQVLRQKYMAEEYRKATEGLNIKRAVYVEIAEAAHRQVAEAEFIIELIRSKTAHIVAAVIGGDPAADSFPQYVRRFSRTPQVKGVRCPLRKDFASDEKCIKGMRLLGELGMSFDLVLGADLLEEAARLAELCPQTQFILDHCGSGSAQWYEDGARQRQAWEKGLASLAEKKNVVCKISGVAEQSEGEGSAARLRPVVEQCLARFGEDRVLFASNWPVCLRAITIAQWLRAVQQIAGQHPEGRARKLFHDNAVRWYRLNG